MKRLIALTVLSALPLYAASALASSELAAKSKCMTCHQVDKKVLGPAFKQVASKYKGQKNAEALLVGSMLKGSKAKWGKIPMPPQNIAPKDALALSKWILSL